MTKHSVLVVDDSVTIRKIVGGRLAASGFGVKLAASAEEALTALQTFVPDVIVSDVSMSGMSGYDLTRQVRSNPATAHVPILLLTSYSGVAQKVAGFEAGADDYVTKPFDPIELEVRIRALLKRQTTPAGVSTAAATPRVIALFSLRGGLGQTTLAVNVALNLARLGSQEVALLDLVVPVGQAAVLLNAKPRHTVADLADHSLEELDPDLVTAHFLDATEGVRLMASPNKPVDADRVSGKLVTSMLPVVAEQFRYTVIDTPHDFGDVSIACLDAATTIVLLLAPDLASVRAAALALDTFAALGYPLEKTRVAMSWVFRKGGLPQKDIEAVLKRKIDVVVPHEPELLVDAINRGVPVALGQPDSSINRACNQVARIAGQLQISGVAERSAASAA